jgi:aspartate racemase
LGVDVPLADIFDSTVESLAKKIKILQNALEPGVLELLEQGDNNLPIVKAVETGQRVEAGLEWGSNANGKYMIPLKKDGSRLPFFGIISFNSYRLLGKYITKEQPLYYLPPTQAASVEDIAAHYVKEIKLTQPTGPYVIGGFCGGGKIAIEVAQQLEAQGDKVSALVLFETYSPIAGLSRKSLKYKKRRLSYYKDRFITLNKSSQSIMDLIKHVFKKSYDKVKKPFVKPAPRKFITSPDYRKYVYKQYSGKVILFQASKPPLDFDDNRPLMGWSEYFTGEIKHFSVEGGHLGIFREPAVKKLAEELSEVLEHMNVNS